MICSRVRGGVAAGSGRAAASSSRLRRACAGVVVLAATNRVHMLDAALLRPGRLDVQLHVPPPDAAARRAILQVHSRGMPIAPDVDLQARPCPSKQQPTVASCLVGLTVHCVQALAEHTEGFSGAELANLCQEAALMALREGMDTATATEAKHFSAALAAAKPSIQSTVQCWPHAVAWTA